MQLAQVLGRVTSTVKHPSLTGWRLLTVQPLGADGTADGDPLLAIDDLGGRRGDRVMLTSDGKSVRVMMKTNTTPVRWAVIGVINE